ncbi:MAG: hypothetical protein KDJ43_10340 [Rhizobiaceae bacterium]|nr:hypothetical protein [Rhizobiaceae bacterium]
MTDCYVIAETWEAAGRVALSIGRGELADLYPDKDALAAAWCSQPGPMKNRYLPFHVKHLPGGQVSICVVAIDCRETSAREQADS